MPDSAQVEEQSNGVPLAHALSSTGLNSPFKTARVGATPNIWCLVSSSKHNELQVKEIAAYALPLIQSTSDVAVLPSEPCTREFAEFCKEILSFNDTQLIWMKGRTPYMTAKDLDAEVAGKLKQWLEGQPEEGQAVLVPYGATPALTKWLEANELHVSLCCDELPYIENMGHKGIMHRHVKRLDQLSMVEKLDPNMKVPTGYTCSTVEDLLVGYRLLGVKEAVVKPIYGKESEGVLFVSSPEELRLYDFPLGDVVLEEALRMDKGPDGIVTSASYVCMGDQILQPYEKVCVGTIKFGIRSTHATPQYAHTTETWTRQLLHLVRPKGPGYFHYVSVDGQPTLLGVRIGQLNTEHFVAMFLNAYAPGAHYFCWHTVPQKNMDVWTFWSRLSEQGAAFTPGQTGKSGVFPLLFLKGVAGTFISIGSGKDEVMRLRGVAEECLREAVAPQMLELISWKDDVRRIWASGPRPEYRRQTQRYNLSNRCIPLVRKDKDVIILPGGHEGTREFANFCKEVLELNDDQVMFTSGRHYNLDDDVDENIISKLKALIITNPGDRFTLVPYAVTSQFQRWASRLAELNVSVFGESLEWISMYGHKGILHRAVSNLDEPSVIERINPKIPVAKGYYCETVEQLLQAYKLLNIKDAVIKPVYGAAGEGILFVHGEEELKLYDFRMGGVCLEEFLNLDRAPDGIILSPAIHYMEGQLVGQGLVDQIMTGTSYTGWRRSCVTKGFQHHSIRMIEEVLRHIKPRGPGGFDFLSVNGKPILTDVNTGRFNGAHSPKLFVEIYRPGSAFYVWKHKPPEKVSVWQFWQRLQDQGIAFVPGKSEKGVFPMIYLPGLSGQFIAIADTDDEAEALQPLADACFKPANRKNNVITPRYSVFKRADIMKKKWRRIWCLSPLNSKFVNQFNVNQLTPLHAVALLRPGVDLVMLPPREDVRDCYNFVKSTFGLQDNQVIWTNGNTNCLHTDIDTEVVERVKSFVGDDNSWSIIPDTPSPSFHRWAGPLVESGHIRVFADNAEWMQQYGHRGVMHRHISKHDQGPVVETMDLGVRVPRGFICSNTQDLVKGYAELGGGRVLIRPTRSTAASEAGVLHCTTEHELVYYDFPMGEVVLEEDIQLDTSEDGLVIMSRIPYIAGERFGNQAVDAVMVGDQIFGYRPSVLAGNVQKQLASVTAMFLEQVNARGAGALTFGMTQGQPVLLGVQLGTFVPEHFVKMFMEFNAENCTFFCWHFVPPKNLDVWIFWSRLLEKEVAFVPGTSKKGVYPLIFLKGVLGTFLAVGPDRETVETLRQAADECLRAPVNTSTLSIAPWSDHQRRIFCTGPPYEYRPTVLRYSLPLSALPLVRPGKDMVVLPGGHDPTREFVEWCTETLKLESNQVVYTSGKNYVMDDDIHEQAISSLKAPIVSNPGDQFVLVPMMASKSFDRWAAQLDELGVQLLGEHRDWGFHNNVILHRHIRQPDTPSVIEQVNREIQVAKGFICSTVEDLLNAYRALSCREVVIKPVAAYDREGILGVHNEEALKLFDFPQGDVILEEVLPLDRAGDGMVLSVCIPFMAQQVLTAAIRDEVIIGSSSMGFRPTEAPKRMRQAAVAAAQEVLGHVQPHGMGNFYFVSVKGEPVLASFETSRLQGTIPHAMFVDMYAPGSSFYNWRFKPPPGMSISQFWEYASSKGLAFEVGGSKMRGVFPMYFLRGLECSMLAIAQTPLECALLQDKMRRAVDMAIRHPNRNARGWPVMPSVQKPLDMILIKGAEAVYGPELLEERNVLIGGGKVVGILSDQAAAALEGTLEGLQIQDASGCVVAPGFVDMRVHITGGGGEAGPASRCHPPRLSDFIEAGITSVVGVLGTDNISRTQEELVIRARALTEEGMSAYTWVGSYSMPTDTLTGSVKRDLCLIENAVGVGEIMLGDARGGHQSVVDIARLASEAHVGGMLAGKSGLVQVHMGSSPQGLHLLRECVHRMGLPITQFLPTHIDRTEELVKEGARWLADGGYADITVRSLRARRAIQQYFKEDLSMANITVSSDAFGSLQTYDDEGRMARYTVADAKALLRFLRNMYFQDHWPLERILPLMTSNPARILRLKNKGQVAVGCDADLLVLNHATLKLKLVYARGALMKTPQWVQGGYFEKGSKIKPFVRAEEDDGDF